MPSSRVAFVGDDDMAAALLLHTDPPARLLLTDIDQRILYATAAHANALADRVSYASAYLDFADTNARDALLAAEGDSYDVVVTDPPYAADGMALFVDTAMRLTCWGGEIHIAVPAILGEAWTDELMLSVQQRLTAAGFMLERITPGMFIYETSEVVSSLLVARRLPGSLIPPAADLPPTGRFYTTRATPSQAPGLIAAVGDPMSGTDHRPTTDCLDGP